jgi:hypothetical protein
MESKKIELKYPQARINQLIHDNKEIGKISNEIPFLVGSPLSIAHPQNSQKPRKVPPISI